MSFAERGAEPHGPRTYVGQWLRATVLGQSELRAQLSGRLNLGRASGWNDDEPAVVEAACELAMSRFFGDRDDESAVAGFVAELRVASGNPSAFDQSTAERVVRSALAGTDVVPGVTPRDAFLIRCLATVLAVQSLGLDDGAVDQLLADAERTAVERGWDPPGRDSGEAP